MIKCLHSEGIEKKKFFNIQVSFSEFHGPRRETAEPVQFWNSSRISDPSRTLLDPHAKFTGHIPLVV